MKMKIIMKMIVMMLMVAMMVGTVRRMAVVTVVIVQ